MATDKVLLYGGPLHGQYGYARGKQAREIVTGSGLYRLRYFRARSGEGRGGCYWVYSGLPTGMHPEDYIP